MHRPQPVQFARSSTIGTTPVLGLISEANAMHPFAHTSTQRPQPLQYSGIRNGLGFSATPGMVALLVSEAVRAESGPRCTAYAVREYRIGGPRARRATMPFRPIGEAARRPFA